MSAQSGEPPGMHTALWVMAAGVCAALHVGKLAPAVSTLQQALGMSLVQAGFLLSLVQAAGMCLGLLMGAFADSLGGRRSIALGLLVLGLASILGATVPANAAAVSLLMALRFVEGLGFLWVVLPAPGLVRAWVPPHRLSQMMGVWGAYMPLATALALLVGPWCLVLGGWRLWWLLLGALSLLMVPALWRVLDPASEAEKRRAGASAARALAPVARPEGPAILSRHSRLRQTLSAPGPWAVAVCFAMYSGQWLAVIGFLPSIVQAAGFSVTTTGLFAAGVAATNIVGNVVAGRLMQRGVAPQRLLRLGFATMALTTWMAFAAWPGTGSEPALPAAVRFVALLVFSGAGGLIPATLFAQAVRLAPSEQTLGSTVGWMQQWSSLGQFLGPPAVAWVASQVGGWHMTWAVTGACCLGGLASSVVIASLLAKPRTAA